MKQRARIILLIAALGLFKSAQAQIPEKKQSWDGSQTVPVHLIPLKDEFDQPIIPTESYPLPFSSRYTCAPCHVYEIIANGLHFDGSAWGRSSRPGEPWIWVDEKTGTVLPLSYQGWIGTWTPRDLEISSWDFTLLFGRHLAGGGVMEPEEDEMSPQSRWNVSGKVEINCMGCHNASRIQSHSEWAKQILRENFRWAATASSGLGEVGGMASRLPGTWDLFDGPNLDDTEWAVAPSIRYHPALFDSKHRVFLDIADRPDDSRCLVCHSVSPVKMQKMDLDADVHTAAGMQCVDCHRNGIDHIMIRGYEGENEASPDREGDGLTCAGCHLGFDPKKADGVSRGRLGAPFPRHRGLPAVHLERLSCTVCHSGARPGKDSTRVRTSRGNRLGIYGVAQWSTDMPHILEPVYFRVDKEKITPHRLLWPAYWGRLEEEAVKPLRPEEVLAAAGPAFASEERVARILLALYREPDLGGIPVMMAGDRLFSLNADGGLDAVDYPHKQKAQEAHWVVKTEQGIVPLIPELDLEAEMLDPEVETRVLNVLDALATYEFARGKPALVVKDAMFLTVEGYLERTQNPGQERPLPWLCWSFEGQTLPLVEEFDLRTVLATSGLEQTLTEEQVELVLEAMDRTLIANENAQHGQFCYVSGGFLFRLNKDGDLTAAVHETAEPALWPLGHRVRPAQQSLGINGCRDCHRANSSFFFGKVRGIGPLLTQRIDVRSQSDFMGLTQSYQKLFGLSFTVRPLLKVVLFVSAVLLGSILLIVFLRVLGRISGLVEKRR